MSKAKIILSALGAVAFASGLSQSHAAPASVAPSAVNVTPSTPNVTPNSVNVTPGSNSINIQRNGYNYGYPYTYTFVAPNGAIYQRTVILPYPPGYYYRPSVPQYYGQGRNDRRRARRSRRW